MAAAGTLPAVEPAFVELGDLGRQALKEMRLLLYELRPPALEQVGLLGAIHQRLAAVEKRAGVDARLVADAVVDLPPALETGLYHITQEALNNILKHAEADTVVVSLNVHGEQLCLEITDNGRGFEPVLGVAASGIGLASMHERATQIGGVLTIDSAPTKGCKVCVTVPMLIASRNDHA
jgi:signal transduction histidine kinase